MNEEDNYEEWDVVVIGGGASGMMAASTAASKGARVLLLEKNPVLGKKLSITGGGRCNVTNNKPEVREIAEQYKDEGKFLFSTFTQHGVQESIRWFLDRGVPFKEENEGRLFPETESALTIRDTLEEELNVQKVCVRTKQSVQSIKYHSDTLRFEIRLDNGVVKSKSCIVATGGYARPETGSTGEGFSWLQSLGHEVLANSSALVPLTLETEWTKKLSGLTLSDVTVSIYAYGKKQSLATGRMLFTHVGVTGPLILNMSKEVGDFLEQTEVTLKLDVFSKYDDGALKEYFKTLLSSNKKLFNALAEELPLQLVKGVLGELEIDGETPCHSVST
jgi:predicted Rossmann fold flavoprotein